MRSISKVFVAVAVAGACGYAAAGTLARQSNSANSDENGFALESLQVAADGVTIGTGNVNYALAGSYDVNDRLRITLGGTAAGLAFTTITAQADGFTCDDGAAGSTAFVLQDSESTSTTLVYAVARDSGALSAGQSCAIPSLLIEANSVSGAGSITISTSQLQAGASGLPADSAAAFTVGSVLGVYSIASVTAFDGVIDVTDERLTFASNAGPTNRLTGDEDALQFSLNVAATHTMISAVTGTMVVTITASQNFNFLIDPGTTTCDVDGTGAATASGATIGSSTIAVTACSSLAFTIPTVAAGVYDVVLGRGTATPTVANSAPFLDQTYSGSAVGTIRGAGTGTASVGGNLTAAQTGAWTINGATVTIPYMPVNPNIDLIVNIANQSTQTGEVTFTARNVDGVACSGSLGSIGANSNGSFGGPLKAALLACVGDEWTAASRATVVVTAPIPQATTFVNTSFSTTDGKSRQIVINSRN